MRIVIASDLEGVNGVDDYRMVLPHHTELFHQARVNLTKDINAAIQGVRRAGAAEVFVIDGHAGGNPPNILDDELVGGAQVLRGSSAFDIYQQELAAELTIGAHAMAGTRDGFMSHTTSGMTSMVVNGQPIGETAKLGWLAEFYGVPLVMAAGDAALEREVQYFFPGIETVAVKTATSRASAKSLPREEASRLIEKAAYRAIERRHQRQLYVVPSPVRLEIVLATAEQADRAALIPRTERIEERRLLYIADDYPEAVRAFNTARRLAGATRTEQLVKVLIGLEGAEQTCNEWREGIFDRWIHQEPTFENPIRYRQ